MTLGLVVVRIWGWVGVLGLPGIRVWVLGVVIGRLTAAVLVLVGIRGRHCGGCGMARMGDRELQRRVRRI